MIAWFGNGCVSAQECLYTEKCVYVCTCASVLPRSRRRHGVLCDCQVDQGNTYASVALGLELVVSAHSSLDSSSPLTIVYATLPCIMSYTTKDQQHRFPMTSLTLISDTLWQPVCCASLACPSLRPNRKTVPIWPLQILAWWQCSPLSRISPPTSLPLRFGRCEILIASLGIGLFLSVISDQNIILSCKYNYWDGRNMGVLLGGRGSQAWEDYWEGAMAFFLNHLSPVC